MHYANSLGKFAAMSLVVILAACVRLPSLSDRQPSSALPPSVETELGQAIGPLASQHEGKTGVAPLVDSTAAFAARMLLAETAQTSIDAQYYIWHKDLTGLLLLQALKNAADRGVRVRLLLDDNGTPDLDQELAILNEHPNIEIRLFNPFIVRDPRWLNFVLDFARSNRRMHNKSYTVDNTATIIGGRNVGDVYFGTGPGSLYIDLDVLALGEAVTDVSEDFDRYWSSQSAYPVDLIIAEQKDDMSAFEKAVAKARASPQFEGYRRLLHSSDIVKKLVDNNLPLEWIDVKLVSDDPAKGLGAASRDQLLINRLTTLLGSPQHSLDLVSAYFVPGKIGFASLRDMERNGVEVRILTNAMEATDVVPVHAGYAKYRRALLASGVEIFELKAAATAARGEDEMGPMGSSGASLHAKIFAVDRDRVFIGSFNFDPRSAMLNTEMGFLIESPSLASEISDGFDNRLSRGAYQPKLSDDEDLFWIEITDENTRRYDKEPNTSVFQRCLVTLIGWLPVEWLL